ncbi:MAG: MerR family DNA-binding transcriptional regulator [Clostridiales bacterium]|nr:MerR family DNA-binding transcriptional regulator [Clostridiales bacterium]
MIINDVSKKYNLSVRTLRYYEEIGLISSTRNDANIRVYDSSQLSLLEEILVYKALNIKLQDIKLIVCSDEKTLLRKLLFSQLNELNASIFDLKYKRQLIRSTLETFASDRVSKSNLKSFIEEQLFFSSSDERWTNMLENNKNITIDIGENLIPIALKDAPLWRAIKALRVELKENYDYTLDKVRVKDNVKDLNANEFQILYDDEIKIKKDLLTEDQSLQIDQIITQLKALII